MFTSTNTASSTDFTFTRLISHRGRVTSKEPKASDDTSGSDAALAALKSSLASYEQEKQAKQTNITNSVLPMPKNRFDAARKERLEKKRPGHNGLSQPASPLLSATATPRLSAAPTSAPASENDAKMQAMKKPLIHLLAMGPLSHEEIVKKTHIPKADLDDILLRIGKQNDGKWQLMDRASKDLDVWDFEYSSQEDRQAAIDNTVRAFDRMRLGKEETLWQMLLPKKDRGKGIVLSRLNMGGGNRGLTLHYQPSPMHQLDNGGDVKLASGANTPRLGGSTPRPGSSKGDVTKRLLSKDPKKARALEEAKEKKRKEREAAAASDREGGRPAKKPATKKATSNIKSAEFVHSSDDASDDEIELKKSNESQLKVNKEAQKSIAKSQSTAVTSTSSSDSSDAPIKSKVASNTKTKTSPSAVKANGPSSPKTAKPVKASEKATPQKTANSNLSAPNSQHKNSKSPHLPNGRPSVPSPLGAARPRVASDVSDRGAVGVQKVRQGAETPKGLGISDGGRKRHDTITSVESLSSSKTIDSTNEKSTTAGKDAHAAAPEMARKKVLASTERKTEVTAKRKSDDDASGSHAAKHRKTESGSTQSHKSQPSSERLPNGTSQSQASPSITLENGGSIDDASTVMDSITYMQGVNLAEQFRDKYYPAYAKLYDEQAAKEARGETVTREERERLLDMHNRVAQMKREMDVASQREQDQS